MVESIIPVKNAVVEEHLKILERYIYVIMVIEYLTVPCLFWVYFDNEHSDYLIFVFLVKSGELKGRVLLVEAEIRCVLLGNLVIFQSAEHCAVCLVMTVKHKVVRALFGVKRGTVIKKDRSRLVLAAVKCTGKVILVAIGGLFLDYGQGDVGIIYLHPANGIAVYFKKLLCAACQFSAVVAAEAYKDVLEGAV